MYRFFLLVWLPVWGFAQTNTEYQGLLWKISGNGLEQPSYLYGTMHVSNRVAFHLSETFFEALESADIVALETNPETWVKELTASPLYHDFFEMSYHQYNANMPLYSSFVPKEPQQADWEFYLSRDQDLLNNLLYRLNHYDQDFAENTYLDLFIFQAGKKSGKKIVSLEDYQESFKHALLASRQDKNAVYITERQARDLLGDFSDWQLLIEDAYRRGDLDLVDTVHAVLYPGEYYRKYMLDVRNEIMVEGMDSLMKEGVLFTGVGAAHLPGRHGVINLLRERGYTVEPEGRAVSSTSIKRKEEIDEVIFTTGTQDFTSDDGFIRTVVPGEMVKFLSHPYQEYVYADMANGAFYSIRRIATFGQVYGRDEHYYLGRIDSMLFENIPGKILSKDTLEVSGFPALDIQNKTRAGDHQHYRIVFTPLEVIIFKVGGHKEFARSALPKAFFDNIKLVRQQNTEKYTPNFHGFEVHLPGELRMEQYEAAFENPRYTFWAQSHDNEDYYAVGLRQFHDFDYLEEDEFELKFLVEKIAEEKKLELDTLYLVTRKAECFSRFELSNKKGQKLFGEIHLEGPKFAMLISNALDEEKRMAFFSSFSFRPWNYPHEFREYTDTVFHIVMNSPVNINNYETFLNELSEARGRQAEEDHSYRGSEKEKKLTYWPTGEQLQIKLEILHKFISYSSLEAFWSEQKKDFETQQSLKVVSDSILYTKNDSNYLAQARMLVLADTNTHRVIKTKMILENGALYSLWASTDTLGYSSAFAERALASFRTAGDTVIGLPVTLRKADMFFDALDSKDSLRVFEASKSVYAVSFEEADAPRIKEYVTQYEAEGFDRTARLNLLNRLSWLDDERHIKFLEDLYYQKLDSSEYMFKILETLVDFNTKRGNKSFKKLILDEPPFSSNTYKYSSLFSEFRDAPQNAPVIYPDILTLADFEDYRSSIYKLLAHLLDSGHVSVSDYKTKYKALVLFAKVELKKQHAKDEQRQRYGSKATTNVDLLNYTKLLTPFARKKEVKEHFRNILSIRNERVLAELLVVTDPYVEVPDSVWNFVAKDPKAFYKVYPYLLKTGKLKRMDESFQTKDALAKSILMNSRYTTYDSVSFIRSEKVTCKGLPAEAFFFRAKNEKDKLWKLFYVVVKEREQMGTDHLLARTGEEYNEKIADLDEIIEDALKDIRVFGRRRYVKDNQFSGLF